MAALRRTFWGTVLGGDIVPPAGANVQLLSSNSMHELSCKTKASSMERNRGLEKGPCRGAD